MGKAFIKNIVVAINGTQSSIQAAMYGIILAKQYSLNMKAVYVVDTATIKYLTNSKLFIAEERDSYEAALRRDGEHYLNYVTNLAKSKGVKIETELRDGSVCAEIIASADSSACDLILIGGKDSHNKYIQENGPHSVLATARNDIVEYAHCPVMVVHRPEIEALFKII